MMNETQRTFIDYAVWKHQGQFRDNGTPFIVHPVRVTLMLSNFGFSIEHQLAGTGHDLLEDTKATYDDIEALVGNDVAQAILLLTKDRDSYPVYFRKISENDLAKPVKVADRIDNLLDMTGPVWTRDKQVMYLRKSVKHIYPMCDESIGALGEEFVRVLKMISADIGCKIDL